MEKPDWRDAWHFGYEFNKTLHQLQRLNPRQADEMDNAWICPRCDRFVVMGYLCRCNRNNADDLRYFKDKEDGKWIFGR